MTTTHDETIRETVRDRYASAARLIDAGSGGCCSTGDPITAELYTDAELAGLPREASLASLGCGNPTALATLEPGETVLDLGSGGGIDVLLSARRVGPEGFAYGLDMTDEMLALAERNRAESGLTNVAFLKGHIEAVPLEADAVDVVISNCVINLSSDKGQVLREAFRVLRPGGRFAVSDVVTRGELPTDLRADMEAWVGCVAGALDEDEYRQLLADAGFVDVEVQVTRVYDPGELMASLGGGSSCCGGGAAARWNQADLERFEASGGQVMSAFVRARKPAIARQRSKESLSRWRHAANGPVISSGRRANASLQSRNRVVGVTSVFPTTRFLRSGRFASFGRNDGTALGWLPSHGLDAAHALVEATARAGPG